jgi:hypothetical protein
MRFVGIGIAVALAAVLGLANLTQAAPVDLGQVSADAKGLVHIDVDAIRASTVVQNAWKKCQAMHPKATEHMDKVKGMIGMDPRTDLHGITMYGKKVGSHEGVLLVNAKLDQKLLLEKAAKAPDHKVVKHGNREIHTWTDKHHGPKTVAGAFYKDGVAFGSSVEELNAALDVLDGKAPAVGSGSALAGHVPPGTTVMMRATGIAEANLPCKSPVAKQMESVRVAMGENDGQSFFRAKATMTNADIVGQVKIILDGGRAMALLHSGKDEAAKKLIDAAKVTSEGKTLTILWSAPATDVWAMMEKLAKKAAEHHAKMGKKGPWQHKAGEKKDACPAQKCPAEKKAPAKPREDEF